VEGGGVGEPSEPKEEGGTEEAGEKKKELRKKRAHPFSMTGEVEGRRRRYLLELCQILCTSWLCLNLELY
jgi:hypothetical protein